MLSSLITFWSRGHVYDGMAIFLLHTLMYSTRNGTWNIHPAAMPKLGISLGLMIRACTHNDGGENPSQYDRAGGY
jgi:hypothetical protein